MTGNGMSWLLLFGGQWPHMDQVFKEPTLLARPLWASSAEGKAETTESVEVGVSGTKLEERARPVGSKTLQQHQLYTMFFVTA